VALSGSVEKVCWVLGIDALVRAVGSRVVAGDGLPEVLMEETCSVQAAGGQAGTGKCNARDLRDLPWSERSRWG
jgi:hypothetical protein